RFGPSNPNRATSFFNLASSHERAGHYERALVFAERALALRESQLGSEHIVLCDSLELMGAILRDLGRYDQANVQCRRSLAILDRQTPAASVAIRRSYALTHLAQGMQAQHKFHDALDFHRRALAALEGANSDDKMEATGTILAKLAGTLNKMGRH